MNTIRTIPIVIFLLITPCLGLSQGFTNWITGDTADFSTSNHLGGIVLAGGGTDNDQAMQWMLNRAGGGDIVVIRASGSDGYNNYFYSELGVNVNSVETIRFDDTAASTDAYVIQQIRNAEVLFIAGGDQYDYFQFWKDQPIEDALNYLINEKGVTVGGTSAGMAILGNAYYTPSGGSLDSDEALSNPFHPDINILGKDDFIQNPYLPDLVTDTHYDQRDRQGRHMTFLARLANDYGIQSYGIACNEVTAVCIDEAGIARVFGEYPDYPDFAYFLKSNCQSEFVPEVILDGSPLTWNRSQAALKVYKVPGMVSGATNFDLNDWETGNGGDWEAWYVENGELLKNLDSNSDCDETTALKDLGVENDWIQVFPNPFQTEVFVKRDKDIQAATIKIFDITGSMVFEKRASSKVESLMLDHLNDGNYILEYQNDQQVIRKKITRL